MRSDHQVIVLILREMLERFGKSPLCRRSFELFTIRSQ
ncbi:hypothetical protein AZE42_13144 [Rhizopogon vesiculosus]|uniref:Uncharacterized protein n=1 Tax=Rhizopogon vesiculosus TaxID=180088 RepID=A0A1J8QX07_9AGAM|nr:hypothetical protein AZE42_13144 [Rhizopogon vesiculosus]